MSTAGMIADTLKGGLIEASPYNVVLKFHSMVSELAYNLKVDFLIDSGLTTVQVANVIRGSIIARLNRGVEVAAIGAARGYLLPNDPTERFAKINATRRLFDPLAITTEEANQLTQAVADLIEVGIAYDNGTVTFDRPSAAAQLASFDVSVDGIVAQSGDALVDILGYQPDADYVKRKRALDSLAKLDFSKRKPYLLFTADVIVGGKRQDGTIVCWMKMRDASGYSVTKRDVFAELDFPKAFLSNSQLDETTRELLADNNFRQILSFYDWVRDDDIYAFIDASTHPDTLYTYVVTGVQNRIPASPFMFDVPTNALYLSAGQVEQLRQFINEDLAAFGGRQTDGDSISPYPALSRVIYGDPGFGWILAGCNVLAAQRRNETNEQVRSLSFIGSRASELIEAAAAGRVVIPTDLGTVHASVDRSVPAFGVSQTMLCVLDGIGVTMFISGKDDLSGFQPTQQILERTQGGLAKILGAIDPQTATIDPKMLSAALATSTVGSGPKYTATPIYDFTLTRSDDGPTAGSVPPPTSPSLETVIGPDLIDLTSYDGIARLMQLIRVVYDFYPGGLS